MENKNVDEFLEMLRTGEFDVANELVFTKMN